MNRLVRYPRLLRQRSLHPGFGLNTAMVFFHWEYVIFPIIVFILIALILAVILAADLKSEDQTKMELIKGLLREFMKRLHRR
jgi:hypothetical protein